MKKTASILSVVTALILSPPSGLATAEEQSATEDVLTAQIPKEGSDIAWGQAVLVVDRPIADVLPIIRDYGNYVQFVPHFTRSQVLAQRGSRALVYVEVSVAKGAFTLWGQLSLAEHPAKDDSHVVEALLMEGNINAFNARWTLTPVNDGAHTRLSFELYVDPDMPMPSSIFSRQNEKAAARMVRAIRTRAVGATPPLAEGRFGNSG